MTVKQGGTAELYSCVLVNRGGAFSCVSPGNNALLLLQLKKAQAIAIAIAVKEKPKTLRCRIEASLTASSRYQAADISPDGKQYIVYKTANQYIIRKTGKQYIVSSRRSIQTINGKSGYRLC